MIKFKYDSKFVLFHKNAFFKTKFSVSSRQGLSFKAFQEPFNDHSLPELGHCCAKMPESFSPLFNLAKYGPYSLLVKI